MVNRYYIAFVMLFWGASMAWLGAAKVLPPLFGGDAPDYRSALTVAPKPPPPVVWRMDWEDRTIGYAVTQVHRLDSGRIEMRSLVRFEQLDVKRILQQLLGVFAKMVPALGDDELRLDMTIASRAQFSREQRLEAIASSIAVADLPHVLSLHGEVQQGSDLQVVVFSGKEIPWNSEDNGKALFRQTIELPRDAILSDAFAPHSELKDLQVGQTWTIPVYRPFPPNSPVQILEARAERLDLISWNRETVETMLVVYRSEAGSGLATARRPIGRLWVRPDGLVLRQEVMASNLLLVFERVSDDQSAAYADALQDNAFLPLLPLTDAASHPAPIE